MTENEPQKETARERLFSLHSEMCKQSLALMRKKNADYGRVDDPLLNFRRHGALGIIVRMDDKMARLDNIIKKGYAEVDDEMVIDTLKDVINYAVLLEFWLNEDKK